MALESLTLEEVKRAFEHHQRSQQTVDHRGGENEKQPSAAGETPVPTTTSPSLPAFDYQDIQSLNQENERLWQEMVKLCQEIRKLKRENVRLDREIQRLGQQVKKFMPYRKFARFFYEIIQRDGIREVRKEEGREKEEKGLGCEGQH
jgi:hypothetical protein